jgi:uncharacterized protein with HEPN domain
MPPDERDAAYLWDIVDAAQRAREFVAGLNYHQYQKDRKTQMAVERAVEIIGEAARRISTDFQQAHQEIPWRNMIALRNVLAHEYGEIKQEIIWQIATVRALELITLIEPLIPIPPVDSKTDIV